MRDLTRRRQLRLNDSSEPNSEQNTRRAMGRAPLRVPRTVALSDAASARTDMVVLSHLRWDFVFQRPQHLLTRCARDRRVFFVEEPLVDAALREPRFEITPRERNIAIARVHVPPGLTATRTDELQRALLNRLFGEHHVREYVLWYYTPMALSFSRHLAPRAVVFDCMDELANFAGAPAEIKRLEAELLARADVVFCGGFSLWEAKRGQHGNIHPFPSSIDRAHFATARSGPQDPADQQAIARPRLGYFGVIDERLDYGLIEGIAERRPDWQVVLLGPVVKVDPASLPRRPNIHWLGGKSYADLPRYVGGWDVALMPFALNDATRFISPTKTPEYLAAGRPVVSTAVRDVVRSYGDAGLVQIAADSAGFVAACERALAGPAPGWLEQVDEALAAGSWDSTWERMAQHIAAVTDRRRASRPARTAVPDAAAALD